MREQEAQMMAKYGGMKPKKKGLLAQNKVRGGKQVMACACKCRQCLQTRVQVSILSRHFIYHSSNMQEYEHQDSGPA